MPLKLGIDIHSVLDKNPEFFVNLSKHLNFEEGDELHIITGSPHSEFMEQQLLNYNDGRKWWTHYFGIVDYLLVLNKKFMLDENGRFWFNSQEWDTAKAFYCKSNNIDLHIDDMDEYLIHFTTDSIHYDGDNEEDIADYFRYIKQRKYNDGE